jgi:hypothetical protein
MFLLTYEYIVQCPYDETVLCIAHRRNLYRHLWIGIPMRYLMGFVVVVMHQVDSDFIFSWELFLPADNEQVHFKGGA